MQTYVRSLTQTLSYIHAPAVHSPYVLNGDWQTVTLYKPVALSQAWLTIRNMMQSIFSITVELDITDITRVSHNHPPPSPTLKFQQLHIFKWLWHM